MKKLLEELEREKKKIIEENGYSEMADGFDQAYDIIKKHLKGIINAK